MSVYIPNDVVCAMVEDGTQHGNMMESEHHGNTVERWSSRLTLRFVLLYGAHPCLWDPSHSEYKNKLARDKAVQGIIDGMGLAGFDVKGCRRKIRIIRSTYWNECTKISRSTKYGMPYRPKLSWFPQAHQFLSKIPGWKEIQGWKADPVEPELDVEELMSPDDQLKRLKADPDAPPQAVLDAYCKDEDDPASSALYFSERDAPPAGVGAGAGPGASCAAQQDNEFEIFGKSIACQLRQLPLVDALEAQMEIQTLVSQRRLRGLREQCAGPPQHAHAHALSAPCSTPCGSVPHLAPGRQSHPVMMDGPRMDNLM